MRTTKSNSTPYHIAVTFSYRRGRTRIHKTTIEELGRPPYVRMLFNPDINSLAIQGFMKKVKDAIRVPSNLFEPNGTFEISSTLFLESIRKRMHWDRNLTYLVIGRFDPRSQLVIFNLKRYEIINDEE